jgi:hypothetical protein
MHSFALSVSLSLCLSVTLSVFSVSSYFTSHSHLPPSLPSSLPNSIRPSLLPPPPYFLSLFLPPLPSLPLSPPLSLSLAAHGSGYRQGIRRLIVHSRNIRAVIFHPKGKTKPSPHAPLCLALLSSLSLTNLSYPFLSYLLHLHPLLLSC